MTYEAKPEEAELLTAHARLVEGPWRPLSVSEQCEFLLRLELHLMHAGAPPLTRTHLFLETWAARLPFYPEVLLLSSRVERPDGSVGVLDVLLGNGVIFCLSGAGGLIHDFNAGRLQPLQDSHPAVCKLLGHSHGSPLARLGESSVGLAYLRFFCEAVRAEGGGFHIVESATQLARLGVVDRRGELASLVAPMRWLSPAQERMEDTNQGNAAAGYALEGWSIKAHVVHAGDLYETQFLLLPDGQVEMVDDVTLATRIGPSEVHSGLLRSILLPDAPPLRQRRGRQTAPVAVPKQDRTLRVRVPAHLVLSPRDPLLGRLAMLTQEASAAEGESPAAGLAAGLAKLDDASRQGITVTRGPGCR